MPSSLHDGLVKLFDNRPELAAEVLAAVGVTIPGYHRARVEAGDLRQARSVEFQADLVISFGEGSASVTPALAVIVEVQLRTDADKLLSWPVYVPSVRARLGCPVVLLVVTPSDAVARWARRPIAVGPGTICTPLVVELAALPVVTGIEQAARNPELAVLSAMAHGKGDPEQARRIGHAAMRAAARLAEDLALLYSRAIWEALGPAARKALKMDLDVERLFDPKVQKKIEKARVKGRAEGRAQGRAEGRAQAKEEALRSKRRAVLAVLDARELLVTERQRSRVLACISPRQLEVWLRRAATAPSTTAALDGRGGRRPPRASSAGAKRTRR